MKSGKIANVEYTWRLISIRGILFQDGYIKYHARLYENIKKEISKIKSERGKKFRHTEESKKKLHDAKLGIKNPSYGKKWYHNPLTM